MNEHNIPLTTVEGRVIKSMTETSLTKDFLYCLEEEYKRARKLKLSRFSIDWGKFSREMNLVIRQLVKDDHPEKDGLTIIYNLWILYSTLLELSFKFPQKYRRRGDKRKLSNMIVELKREINK